MSIPWLRVVYSTTSVSKGEGEGERILANSKEIVALPPPSSPSLFPLLTQVRLDSHSSSVHPSTSLPARYITSAVVVRLARPLFQSILVISPPAVMNIPSPSLLPQPCTAPTHTTNTGSCLAHPDAHQYSKSVVASSYHCVHLMFLLLGPSSLPAYSTLFHLSCSCPTPTVTLPTLDPNMRRHMTVITSSDNP